MGQLATIERSRLRALDVETVIALATAHGHGDRTECETQLAWAMGYTVIAENK